MNDASLKEDFARAFQAPPVPQDLVERTVVRARAIESGRQAEQKLAEARNPEREELVSLVAQSVVGRLMYTHTPPDGVDEKQMADSLRKNEKFSGTVTGSPTELLSALQNGKLISRFADKKQAGPQQPAPAAPERTIPEKAAPEKDPITRGGLGF